MLRKLAPVLASCLVLGAPGIAAAAQPRTNLADIEDEVMCPICGTALGLSESPQADREREFIRRLVAEGRTKDEIKAALVAEYGEDVLAVPGDDGFDLAAWIVPGAALVLAGGAIAVGLRRWRRDAVGPEGDLPSQLSPAEDERLRADLARYDP